MNESFHVEFTAVSVLACVSFLFHQAHDQPLLTATVGN
jgi:hypothetical protein